MYGKNVEQWEVEKNGGPYGRKWTRIGWLIYYREYKKSSAMFPAHWGERASMSSFPGLHEYESNQRLYSPPADNFSSVAHRVILKHNVGRCTRTTMNTTSHHQAQVWTFYIMNRAHYYSAWEIKSKLRESLFGPHKNGNPFTQDHEEYQQTLNFKD